MITERFVKINTYIDFNYRQNGYFTLRILQDNFLLIYTKQTKAGAKFAPAKIILKYRINSIFSR